MLPQFMAFSAVHPVRPLQLPVHLAAGPLLGVRSGQDAVGLVGVQDRLLEQRGFELRFEVYKSVRGQLKVQGDNTAAGTRPAQVLKDLRGAFQRNEMGGVQVDRQPMDAETVLHPAGNVIVKSSVLAVRAPWTDPDACAVFGHLEAKLW